MSSVRHINEFMRFYIQKFPTTSRGGKPRSAAEILEAAADHIDEHGWQQGSLGRTDRPTCALGSMLAVADLKGRRFLGLWGSTEIPALAAAVAALELHVGEVAHHRDVTHWNDTRPRSADGRGAREVTRTMREVAATLNGTTPPIEAPIETRQEAHA